MTSSIPSRILITGCTGFVGRYVVEQCRLRYPQADLFGLAGHAASMMTPVQSAVKLLVADITQRDQIHQVLAQVQPDLIIHLAAQSSVADSWKNPQYTLRVNAEGTIHLLEALHDQRLAPRIVLVGSGEQYGLVRPEENPIHEDCLFRPANPYAVSKATQDLYGYQYFIAYGLPIVRARPFNHFGPGQSSTFVIAKFARQVALIEAGKAPPEFPVGNLEARRDFLPVEDLVAAYLMLAEQGQPGKAYNIGSGHSRSIRSILDLLLTLSTISIRIYEDPALLRPVDVPLLEADTSRLQADTNWQPAVPFEVALQHTLDYWRTVVASEAS
ncbi:MAG TPA: GDP-mannose 4,6-dehydratase [Ktedonobacteraceae bacterium]|nr:GDP-mannose 4,6-dehydratase [Ktedonobacteraceae bacterium]